MTTPQDPIYAGCRYPAELISCAVWLYFRFPLSLAWSRRCWRRAVDQEGFVLDVLVQSRRDKKVAKRLFHRLLKKQARAPRVLITDKLKSYAAAKRKIMPGVEHRQHKGLNNRADDETRS